MHVGAKRMAAAGLLVAFTVIMLVLSSMIETNSLFFIVAASFCVGIAIREWGLGFGFGFLMASILMNVLIAPNKMYCITYGAMGIYLWLSELLWEKIALAKSMSGRNIKLWIGKYIAFNLIYIPVLIFFPRMILVKVVLAKELAKYLSIILFFAGQLALLVYDVAYRYFQAQVWGRLRARLGFGK